MCGTIIKTKPKILAISGVKNSGKTTYIEKLVLALREKGLKVAVIKHDGHDFEADVNGTDSDRYAKAGAYGTAIFSKNKFMIVKNCENPSEKELIDMFSEGDIILLEGFKYSNYPKIELIRKGISHESVCKRETLLALVTDTEITLENVPRFDFDEINEIFEYIL